MFKIGYLPLSKVNWTNDTLEAARANAISFLKTLPDVEVIAPDHMLALEGEAIEVLDQWEKDRPDLIVAHFLTFSLGVVPPMFAQRLKVPILLWSQPEPDPKGGRLQNNSFCAANMNAHHMWRLGIPYFYVHAQAGTKEAETQLMKQIRVAQAMKALGRMRIGLIGGRVPGFFTSCVDEMMLRRTLGPEVKIITEHELFTVAKNLTADEVAKGMAIIDEDLKTPSADAPRGDQKEKSARLIAAVMKLKEKFFVDTFAMRCWPEVILSEFYGIAVCSTLGPSAKATTGLSGTAARLLAGSPSPAARRSSTAPRRSKAAALRAAPASSRSSPDASRWRASARRATEGASGCSSAPAPASTPIFSCAARRSTSSSTRAARRSAARLWRTVGSTTTRSCTATALTSSPPSAAT